MGASIAAFGAYARASKLVLAELLWPTRCVICEAYGRPLCPECMASLPFIDQWRACKACGAPYGMRQCTECNAYTLTRMGIHELPYQSCVSAVLFDELSSKVVRAYKDAGERRLAAFIALMIARAIPPSWIEGEPLVAFVPSTAKACRARGFDHCEEIAGECARLMGLGLVRLLDVGAARDQRRLGRSGRMENARERFTLAGSCAGADVILVDDVLTTGSTLLAASEAIKGGGARTVRCATFARVH